MKLVVTVWEADVLAHTSSNGRFVTLDPRVIALANRGLLLDHGAQALAAGDHYLTLSCAGREALQAFRDAQPKPAVRKRSRKSEVFEGWQSYCEAFSQVPFSVFWKTIWPRRKELS